MSFANSHAYTPSIAAAGVFAGLFLVQAAIIPAQVFHYRRTFNKNFCERLNIRQNTSTEEKNVPQTNALVKAHNKRLFYIALRFIPITLAALVEGVAYIIRIAFAKHTDNIHIYIAQTVLMLLGPIYQFLAIFLLFHRLMKALQCTSLFSIDSNRISRLLVILNVTASILQIVGSSTLQKDYHKALNTLIAGVAVQIACFGLLALFEFTFASKLRSDQYPHLTAKWKMYSIILCLSTLMILVRSIIRIVEFKQGLFGYMFSHEAFLYVFDTIPVFLVGLLFCSTIPARTAFQIESEVFDQENPFSEDKL